MTMTRWQAGAVMAAGLALSGDAMAGECVAELSTAEVGAKAQAVVTAFYEGTTPEEFSGALAALDAAVPCLSEPIAVEDAAQVHFAGALQAYANKRDDHVVASLRAAVNADRSFSLTDSQAPDGSPLRLAFEEARKPQASASAQLDAPPCVSLVVDGDYSTVWIADRPAVLQPIGPDGELLWTELVGAGERPPAILLECPGTLSPPTEEGGDGDHSSSPVVKTLLGGGAVLSTGAAGYFLWQASQANTEYSTFETAVSSNDDEYLDGIIQDYEDAGKVPADYVSDLQAEANRNSTAAIASGVVAVGFGVALVITW